VMPCRTAPAKRSPEARRVKFYVQEFRRQTGSLPGVPLPIAYPPGVPAVEQNSRMLSIS
jgi:hypothetical protein